MRRIVSCLIVGGLLAGGPGVGISDDRSASENAPAAPAQQTAEQGSAERQNYSELFGGSGERPGEGPEWATESRANPGADSPRRGSFTLSRSPQTTTESRATVTEPDAAEPSGVVHAEYEQNHAQSSGSEIEQVAGSEIAPARPVETTNRNRLAQPVATGLPARRPAGRTQASAATPSTAGRTATAPAPATESDSQTPSVSVEWRRASEINVGREFECDLVVKNQGPVAARNIQLTASIPQHVRLVSAEPKPSNEAGALNWSIVELAAGQELVYALTLLPQEAGEIATHAQIRFTGSSSARFEVAEPKLAIKLEGPTEVMIGEAATQIISVTNPGTGVAENVKIEALIPPGLEHVRGTRLLMDLGALHPGEVRSIRLPLAAVAGGVQTVQVQSRADLGLSELATADVSVMAPQLTSSIQGPGLRYVGRRATYTVSVRNEGSVTTDNVQVLHKVPDGFELVEADDDVKFDENLQMVSWYVGALGRGQTAQTELTFDCHEIGAFTHYVRATSEHGVISDASVSTSVEGVSSLVMEIQDLEDPVEVGTETVYELRVKNEGSAPANDIRISCELPAGITLLNVTGPVEYAAEQDLIVFRPIQTLAPNGESTFQVHVSSTEAGNLRFRARLSSASIGEPLIKEELTRFYGE